MSVSKRAKTTSIETNGGRASWSDWSSSLTAAIKGELFVPAAASASGLVETDVVDDDFEMVELPLAVAVRVLNAQTWLRCP